MYISIRRSIFSTGSSTQCLQGLLCVSCKFAWHSLLAFPWRGSHWIRLRRRPPQTSEVTNHGESGSGLKSDPPDDGWGEAWSSLSMRGRHLLKNTDICIYIYRLDMEPPWKTMFSWGHGIYVSDFSWVCFHIYHIARGRFSHSIAACSDTIQPMAQPRSLPGLFLKWTRLGSSKLQVLGLRGQDGSRGCFHLEFFILQDLRAADRAEIFRA